MVKKNRFIIKRKDSLAKFDDSVIESDGLTIGRLVTNELVLNHRAVSRAHCGIKVIEEKYWIFNQSFENATLVNGAIIEDRVPLEDGDLIQVGPFVLVVNYVEKALLISIEMDLEVVPVVVQADAGGEADSSGATVRIKAPGVSALAKKTGLFRGARQTAGASPDTAIPSQIMPEDDERALDIFWEKRKRESGKVIGGIDLKPKGKRLLGKAQFNWRPTLDLRETWRISHFIWGSLIALLIYLVLYGIASFGAEVPASRQTPTELNWKTWLYNFGAIPWYIWVGMISMLPIIMATVIAIDTVRRKNSLKSVSSNIMKDEKDELTKFFTLKAKIEGSAYPHPVINKETCIGCRECVEACPHDVITIINGKAAVVAIDQCMEEIACQVECPTNPKSCIVVNSTKKIPARKVPQRDPRLETNVPGIYMVGDISGTPLIKNAINEGRKVIDSILEDFQKNGRNPAAEYDVAVVGLGPGGLSSAVLAAKEGLSYVAFERDTMAGMIQQTYQAGKFVFYTPADKPVVGGVPLTPDPAKPEGNVKEAMVKGWFDAMLANDVKVNEEEPVVGVRYESGFFIVVTERGLKRERSHYTVRKVIIAIGGRGGRMKLRVPGEETKIFVQPEPEVARICPECGASNTECSLNCPLCGADLPVKRLTPYEDSKVKYKLTDPTAYNNKRCLVVGASNLAVEAAVKLAGLRQVGNDIVFTDGNEVTFIVRSDFSGELTLSNKMDMYDCIDAGKIKVYLASAIKEIKENEVILMDPRTKEEKARIMNDYIFAFVGSERPIRFLENLGIKVG
jgi:thioredoxin reductase